MRKRTTYIMDVADVDCELTFEPIEAYDILSAKIGDKIVVGYITYDNDYRDIDDMMGDCMGKMYSFHRHASRDDHSNGLEALGNNADGEANLDAVWEKHWAIATERLVSRVRMKYELSDIAKTYDDTQYEADYQDQEKYVESCLRQDANDHDWACHTYDEDLQAVLEEMWSEPAFFPGDRDAQLLACYSHSGEMWSLSGSGTQCRWDTSNSAGVWVPDEYLRKELDDDEAKGKNRDDQARMYCKQFLNIYNDIINGQVFGCVVEWFDEDGTSIDHDSCWGFVGYDDLLPTLKGDYFDPKCERLRKEHEHDVHTQCDKQLEMPV